MHHKILKHLLTLFFVLILLSILGMQWMVKENTTNPNEEDQIEEIKQQKIEYPVLKNRAEKNLEIRIH